jgi:hypothetical protein
MDILRRFLSLTLREKLTELRLSEARRNQVYMMQYDDWQTMRRDLKLARCLMNSNDVRPSR